MHFSAVLDDRSVIEVAGPEARAFLQGLICNDMAKCGPDRALYAALLTPQGKILFDFFVIEPDAGRFILDCFRSHAADLFKRLSLYRLRAKIEIAIAPDIGIAATWNDGGTALEIRPGMLGVSDPRLEELGQRMIGPRGRLRESLVGTASGDYPSHRLDLGVPDSADLPPDTVFALDAGFEELSGVDFRKGCYVGQEVTSRMKHRAAARRRFFIAGIVGEWPAPGTPLVAAGLELGTLATGMNGRGLAHVRLDRVMQTLGGGAAITAEGRSVTLTKPSWLRV